MNAEPSIRGDACALIEWISDLAGEGREGNRWITLKDASPANHRRISGSADWRLEPSVRALEGVDAIGVDKCLGDGRRDMALNELRILLESLAEPLLRRQANECNVGGHRHVRR